MTTNEIAQAVNKDVTTVQRWIKRLNGKMQSMDGKMQSSTSTYPADFDLDETIEIVRIGLGVNAAEMFRMNAESSPVPQKQNETILMMKEMLSAMPGMIASAVVMAMQQSKPVHYEQQQLDYTPTHLTLLAYSNNNGLGLTDADKRSAGMMLKGICVSRGLDIRQVPDERWGKVNSYPIPILDEYFTP